MASISEIDEGQMAIFEDTGIGQNQIPYAGCTIMILVPHGRPRIFFIQTGVILDKEHADYVESFGMGLSGACSKRYAMALTGLKYCLSTMGHPELKGIRTAFEAEIDADGHGFHRDNMR